MTETSQLEPPKNNHAVNDTEKIYVCHHPGCQKAFHRSYNLKSHMVCHSEIKSFVCECGVGFSRKHDLLRHKKNVHGKVSKIFKMDFRTQVKVQKTPLHANLISIPKKKK
ncbi:hypothetical protein HDU92_006977 [Lobulomyces angularis]|nr:hypothetical protein HDU92_006977 [Lobulomyces angularis]